MPFDLNLDSDGACLAKGAASHLLAEFQQALSGIPSRQAGVRLAGQAGLKGLLGLCGPIGARAEQILGPNARPVRAVLFDKSEETNWALGWHQDRTIAVTHRCELAGFGPWSIKQGIQHVEPPFDVIEAMVTARVHLDPVDERNAPLLIALGSHRLGRIPVGDVEASVARSRVHACLAGAGDVWLYRTPILHASARSLISGSRRRVLQVDYSAGDLPAGLKWLGI